MKLVIGFALMAVMLSLAIEPTYAKVVNSAKRPTVGQHIPPGPPPPCPGPYCGGH